MDIPAVDLGRKVDPGELAEWDLAEWRHLPPPHPTHPFTHAKTHKRTHQVRAQVSVKRERERETQTDVPRRMSEGRERERESSVSQAHRALQTQPQSRHVQFNEDLTSTTETDPNQRIYYTRPTCVFFSPPPLITGDGHVKERREIRTNRRGRKEEGKKERRRRTWGRISFLHGIFPGTRLPFSGCKTERRKRNSTSLYAEKNKGQTEFESDCKMVIR